MRARPCFRGAARAVDSRRGSRARSERARRLGRFTGTLFTIFSALALLLAALGIYGVLAYIVTERTREIGIRMAIVGTAGAISRDVIARGVLLTGLGVVAGGASALALGRAISTLLYGVRPLPRLAAKSGERHASGAAVRSLRSDGVR